MEYSIEHGAGGTTLEVSGDVDLATAERLAEALEVCLEWDGGVTIDLRSVTFMDSSGLRVIIHASQSLNGDGPLSCARPERPSRDCSRSPDCPTSPRSRSSARPGPSLEPLGEP